MGLGVIYRQSRHMHRLIDDLLDVERIKRGKLKLSRHRVEINQCVRDAVEALRGQIEPAGLALELELPQQTMVMDGDADRIVQMVENLIRNSINHTEPGGRITVSARREAGQAFIIVRDTGEGIDPEEAVKLFEPYYQGNKSKAAKGLGLGLALVKRLAEMHGGAIEVYSQGPGTGSAFTLKLPLGTARPARPVLAIAPTPSRRILVVDDQRDIADSFGALLQALGHEVAVAYCGESALEAARRLEPEVAFLDLSMPGMDGHELARRLRQEYSPQRLSLVAVSGLEDKHGSDHAGIFDHWLLKPVAVKTITEVLESARESASEPVTVSP
jgi:CheY-like chemotaxis protein/two-component sensor histidine kinase